MKLLLNLTRFRKIRPTGKQEAEMRCKVVRFDSWAASQMATPHACLTVSALLMLCARSALTECTMPLLSTEGDMTKQNHEQ